MVYITENPMIFLLSLIGLIVIILVSYSINEHSKKKYINKLCKKKKSTKKRK